MWLALIQLAALVCLGALVWYAGETLLVLKRIDISFDRLRAFLDVQDINRRIGTVGEELVAPRRSPVAMPPLQTMTGPPAGDDVAPALPPSDAALPPDLAEVARQMDAANNDGNRLSDDGGETHILNKPAGLNLSSAPPSTPETTPKPGVTPASRHRVSPTAQSEEVRRTSGYHAPFFSPASIPALPSAPAQVAAGIGPRPSSSIVPAKDPVSRAPHAPPVRLTDSTRSVTLIGTIRASAIPPPPPDPSPPGDDPSNRTSWEPLKRGGGEIGASLRPAVAPRFPGTQASMQAVTPPGSPSPSSRRRAAPVEVKEKCRSCDGGFVNVGTGGVGRCPVCKGSSFVDMESRV